VTTSRADCAALIRLVELADLVVPLALRTAAELNVADHLSDATRSIAELAALTRTDARALHALLRCLASKGVFVEPETGRFALTPLAELLTSRHPLSLRDAFPLMAADLLAWARLDLSLHTGRPAFPAVHGQPFWDYMRDHPQASDRMDRALESANRLIVRMFSRLYEWDRIVVLVDVGGGNGSFLAGLLAHYPGMHGVVFDQPHVVAAAARVLEAAGVRARCEVAVGSFFDHVPPGGDAYLLKTILHDWDDRDALRILHAVRAAMAPDGRLLLIEALIPPGNRYDVGKLLDLNSFVLAGGQDRSEQQFDDLLGAAGFRLDRVLRTTNALALMEARPRTGVERSARDR